jgi:hypothetical protein
MSHEGADAPSTADVPPATALPPEAVLARAERALIVLVALHSFCVGLFLVFAPGWGARFGGFGEVTPLFFPRQGGAFHLVAAAVYLVEYFRYRGVLLLVLTKAVAVFFLGAASLLTDVPWLVPLSGLSDAAMAVLVLALRRARQLPVPGPMARP